MSKSTPLIAWRLLVPQAVRLQISYLHIRCPLVLDSGWSLEMPTNGKVSLGLEKCHDMEEGPELI